MIVSNLRETETGAPPVPLQPDPPVERGRRVAVWVDGSRWGQAALRWAAEHAWRTSSELLVQTVGGGSDSGAAPGDHIDDAANKYPLLSIQVRGVRDPASALILASQESDWVVLGRRSDAQHGVGIGGAVLPVSNRARCDVIVVGGAPALIGGSSGLVTALWHGPEDMYVLRSAVQLASTRGAALRIVRAVSVHGVRQLSTPSDEIYRAELDEAVNETRLWQPTLSVSAELVRANPHEVVIRPGATDVLVIGAEGRVGAVGRCALFHSPAPVLIAHETVPTNW